MEIYLVGVVDNVDDEDINQLAMHEIVKKVIIEPMNRLENGIWLQTSAGLKKFRGTIHAILGDHKGQTMLAGIGSGLCHHGSM